MAGLGILGLAGTSLPGWDFFAWLGLLGLARTSCPGWDFLATDGTNLDYVAYIHKLC